MIPLHLRLRNFMCYRDDTPVIDLAGIHLACLAGDNGVGKSALLGAMTWALWGKARDRVQDDDLITQGATEMEVDFEFALGEHRYRVLRKRAKKSGGRTLLNFEVWNDGTWKALTGHTVGETERKIVETLRLDYETFVNSAFLLQGRADSFTMKSSNERKELLGEILNLHTYDVYVEGARKRSRDADAERNRLAGVLAELDRQIARKPLVAEDLARRTEQHAAAVLAQAEAEIAHDALVATLQQLEAQEQELIAVRARMGRDEGEVARLRKETDTRRGRIAAAEAILAERATILDGYTRLRAVRDREDSLSAARAQVAQLEKEKHTLERAIDAARNALVIEQTRAESQLPDLERRAADRPALEQQLIEARAKLAEFDDLERRRAATQADLEARQQETATLQGENTKLKEEMDELKKKVVMLDQARDDARWQHGADHGATPCPLCAQLMDDDAFARVRNSYQQDGEARAKRYRANKRRAADLQTEVERLRAQVEGLDTRLKGRAMAQKRESQYERDLHAATEAVGRLAEITAAANAVQARLQAGDYAAAERAQLATVERRLRDLAFDPAAYEAARRELSALAGFESRYTQLQTAEASLDAEREALATALEALTAREAGLAAEQAAATRLAAALGDLAARRAARNQLRVALDQARRTAVDLADLRARAAHQMEGIVVAERERATQATLQQAAIVDKGVYDELARAFGKAGIQAMIIESVIPELQDEANALLSRMTDGRMALAFETQRQAKTTDSVIETLDIRITDESGVARKYELFSGGEAFRINFAVRIALSKLLARRAGAQLQTLVIDEGFGTQDGQGRERLIGAIRSIQDDFACILVITHIQELKDEFPTRIEITRALDGSRVVVASA